MKRLIMILIVLVAISQYMLATEVILSTNIELEATALSSNDEITRLKYNLGSFNTESVMIDGREYHKIKLNDEPFLTDKYMPELPYINRNIIVPDRAKKELVFIAGEYQEFNINVIPSRGQIYREQDINSIPYQFDAIVYNQDKFFPEKLTELSDPFIIRDFRGQTVTVYPFQYNPVKGILRVYTSMVVEVRTIGESEVNILDRAANYQTREFVPIYRETFLNYQVTRYPFLEDIGRMIVIYYDDYLEAIEPYVEWKIQKGIPTDIYPISHIGLLPGEIKSFLQQEYDKNDGLVYVQLVGNGSQVATYRVRQGAADPVYSLLSGDDNYPDIFIGRFSAQNVSQVETQVERTIYYERDMDENNDWLINATGIASGEGSNPSDVDQMNTIRQGLLSYNYNTVDQIYPPNATSTWVAEVINEGRGLVNYAGHGTSSRWSTTGFSVTSVNNLVNDYKLPFIFSVACQNGNFISQVTSYAESWLRAVNDSTGAPTGGIAFYGSSVNQLWYPPLTAQMEFSRLLTNERLQSIGGLFYNASAKMIQNWGNQGAEEFKNWHIFGDASLQVRTHIPQNISVIRREEIFIGTDSYLVTTDAPEAMITITYEGDIIATGYADDSGNIEFDDIEFPLIPTQTTITVSAFNKVTYIGNIDIVPNEGPYIIIDNITAKGQGENHTIEYGDTVTFDLALKNVGTERAIGVAANLINNDRYVNVLSGTRAFSDIDESDTILIENAFSVELTEDVPDNYQVILSLNIQSEDNSNWVWRFNFRVNAPELKADLFTIDDSESGNNNGRLDPGETISLIAPTLNIGNAETGVVEVSLVSGSPLITIEGESSFILAPITAGEIVYPVFTVSADESIPTGSIFPVGYVIRSGLYSSQRTYHLPVGPITEDFENGNFTSFDWQLSGDLPWVIDSLDVYQGNYSARSGDIGSDQSSEMSVTLNVTEPGYVRFYRRVSSEMNYDFLKFQINGHTVGQWSGEVTWAQVSYPVQTGQNTFKWIYTKDILIDQGYDCAWIDNIEFPTSGSVFDGAVFTADPDLIDFGVVNIGATKEAPFYIRNFGNTQMEGNIELYDGFIITDNNHSDVYEYIVAPDSKIRLNLVFNPNQLKDYSGQIIITSNAENMPEKVLTINAHGDYLSVEDNEVPTLVTRLNANYPNPFNPSTTISYSLERDHQISIEIYNIIGQKVITLVDEVKTAGNHSAIWDGRNEQGSKVTSGIYFYRMRSGEYQNIRKMLYLK